MTGVWLGALGPLSVRVDGEPVEITRWTVRRLLGALLLTPGQPVPVETVAELIGAGSKGSVQMVVSRLRGWLSDIGGDVSVTLTPAGYVLHAGTAQIDVVRFHQLCAATPPSRRSALLDALALWRGEVLADLAELRDLPAAAALRQARRSAVLDAADLAEPGPNAAAVLPHVAALLAGSPYDEPLQARLIDLLAASGRRAEALRHHAAIRRRFADELGTDPGPEVQAAHVRALRDSPSPSVSTGTPKAAVVPRELPAAPPDFVARHEELRSLDAVAPAVVTVICGSGGVGKTALALRWAHGVTHRYPGGQLYVNLHGYDGTAPTPPIRALTELLQSLGVAGERVPSSVDDAAKLYRSVLADRRVLVLLDNAKSADQVVPLLPGAGESLVLVTSRDRMTGLVAAYAAHRVTLAGLDADEARDLLTAIVGGDRVAAEPAAVVELAEACDRLPLALRVVGAQLADQPHQRIADQVDRLRDGRLDALSLPGESIGVRLALARSYQAIAADSRRLLSLLSLVPGADFPLDAATALAGTPAAATAEHLDRLVALHLVEVRRSGRFHLHDLVRAFAGERCQAELSPSDRTAAYRALGAWYLNTVDTADRLLYPERLRLPHQPSPPTAESASTARDRLATELPNVVAWIRDQAERGPDPLLWRLTDALRGQFNARPLLPQWGEIADAALVAADALDAPEGRTVALLSRMLVSTARGDLTDALRHGETALEEARRAGWDKAEAAILGNIGGIYCENQPAEGLRRLREALAINRRHGWLDGVAVNSINIGYAYVMIGDLAPAAQAQNDALSAYRTIGAMTGEASALTHLARTTRLAGDPSTARDLAVEAREIALRVGGSRHADSAKLELGLALCDLGRHDEARALLTEVIDRADETGRMSLRSEGHHALATLDELTGRATEAETAYTLAIEDARAIGSPWRIAQALIGLAIVRTRTGKPDAATECAREAAELARAHGYRELERQARVSTVTPISSGE
ncbi:MAG: tetratricopeptide repeat protein [Hamadaea sp.]|uniref:AfsR/SARP family transcriptional regulator n=1 Tax=Hamadaea sp. TaxID=2024425 RepID=UPI0017E665AA|nr:tetratricopeptide repeat protein [Hamadaea sp.]NUT18959.1 tetratricopeptide repeat protein [Hamadaea sp.]